MACMLTTSAALLPSAPSASRALRSRRPAAAARPQLARRAVVTAAAKPDPETGLIQGLERVLARYDFLSAGLGAMVVTGFCVSRGQDIGTALWITVASTVVALLVNDVIPEDL